MHTDDTRIRDAYRIAQESGVIVSFQYSDEPVEHPNTAKMRIVGKNGTVTEVVGVSIGGGNIRITEINGMTVEISGEYPTLIVQHQDKPGVIAEVSHVLAQLQINIAYMSVFRHGKGEDAYMTIEADQNITNEHAELIKKLCPTIIKAFAV